MPFNINNRRYTGCKNKIKDWIREAIVRNNSKHASFCDLFAGTGIISATLINDFKSLIINDFLYSNEIIYKAFFSNKDYSKEVIETYFNKYQFIDRKKLKMGFFSSNYGGGSSLQSRIAKKLNIFEMTLKTIEKNWMKENIVF